MLLMGDEARRTQKGNNNAFDQDNEISWFDWSSVERNAEIFRFARILIHFHENTCLFRDRQLWNSSDSTVVRWHGIHLDKPDWNDESRSLAFELINQVCSEQLFVMLNAYWEPLKFELPELPPGRSWVRFLDTSLPSPQDINELPVPLPSRSLSYRLGPRSAVVLIAA